MDLLREVFMAANFIAALGHMSLASLTLPGLNPLTWRSLRLRFMLTRMSGFAFFASNGALHIELVLMSQFGVSAANLTSWHILTILAILSTSLVMFLLGLYREVIKPYGLRAQDGDPELDERHPDVEALAIPLSASANDPRLLMQIEELERTVTRMVHRNLILGVRISAAIVSILLILVLVIQGS